MKSQDSFIHLMLSDEEAMHLIWFLTYILLGWQLKIFVDIMFLAWSIINTMEWIDFLIEKYPNLPIIGLFANLVQMTQDNTISIVTLKNYTEVLIVAVSLVMWMWSWCAPVLGIILVQYIRIKFLGSAYTRLALTGCDEQVKSLMPEFLYRMTMTPFKNFLSGLSGVKECLENEKEAADQNNQSEN